MKRLATLLLFLVGLAGPPAVLAQEASSGALAEIETMWRDADWSRREEGDVAAVERWLDWTAEELARFEVLAKDEDPEVASRAAKAFERIRLRRTLGQTLVGRGVAEELESPESTEELLETLHRIGRERAVGLLGPEDVAGLVEWVDRTPWSALVTRETCRQAITVVYEAPGLFRGILRNFLAAESDEVRLEVAYHLDPLLRQTFSGPEFLDRVLPLLESADSEIRLNVSCFLGDSGDRRAVVS